MKLPVHPSADGAQGPEVPQAIVDKAWKETLGAIADMELTYRISPPQGNVFPGEIKKQNAQTPKA